MMQGVNIMLMMTSTEPYHLDYLAKEFYECLIQDNLLDQCKAVVLRITHMKLAENIYGKNAPKPLTTDAVLTGCGLDKASNLKQKLCK